MRRQLRLNHGEDRMNWPTPKKFYVIRNPRGHRHHDGRPCPPKLIDKRDEFGELFPKSNPPPKPNRHLGHDVRPFGMDDSRCWTCHKIPYDRRW